MEEGRVSHCLAGQSLPCGAGMCMFHNGTCAGACQSLPCWSESWDASACMRGCLYTDHGMVSQGCFCMHARARMTVSHMRAWRSVHGGQGMHGGQCMAVSAWRSVHGGQGMAVRAWRSVHGGQCMAVSAWRSVHGGQGMAVSAWRTVTCT